MANKLRLLIFEHWGIGDLALATPFIAAATESFDVSVMAKPFASALQKRWWPTARLIPLVAPWTRFTGKYRLHRWPWTQLTTAFRQIRAVRATHAVSARYDPRDHLLIFMSGAKRRIGFGRIGSQLLLTDNLTPIPLHRYEAWRRIGDVTGVRLSPIKRNPVTGRRKGPVIIHSGAGQPVRIWPVARFAALAQRLRRSGRDVRVACDASQVADWQRLQETPIVPNDVEDLFMLFDDTSAFIGNDSGPGHAAALCGVPTFTIFGPQLPASFSPLHPAAVWIEGKPCIYKPCKDYCHYPAPHCILDISEDEVASRVEAFLADK